MDLTQSKSFTQMLPEDQRPQRHGDDHPPFIPVPARYADADSEAASNKLFWRLRFDLPGDSDRCFGLDIYEEVVLGRPGGSDVPNLVDLTQFGIDTTSISRRHLMLRPTDTSLYLIDLGSTNGTLRNGRSIGYNVPYALVSGDVLTLGDVRLAVQVIDRPPFKTGPLTQEVDIAQALAQVAKAITAQLKLDEVLNQVAETAISISRAEEAGIWLIDEQSGELFLEAQRGIDDERVRRLRLPIEEDTLAGQVIRTGEPITAQGRSSGEKIKLHTSYLVESVAQAPIMLGGVPFGVLSVTQKSKHLDFSDRTVQLLQSIADFAAIAIQNARLYEATDQALAQRVADLAALNEVTSAVSATLDLGEVAAVLRSQLQIHLPVEAVRLYLADDRGFVALEEGEVLESGRRQQGGIIGTAVHSEATLVVQDVVGHADYDSEVDQLDGRVPEQMLCMPLFVQNRVVGVLVFFNKKDGLFNEQDRDWLQAFASPVATAIQNARLFAESERQRMAVQAMAANLSQPILVVDDTGNVLITNEAAQKLLATHMSELFAAMSSGVGRTTETMIGDATFLATTEHLPGLGTILVMQDISYVKQLESDRSDFIHTLSHDLKNPLTSIMGWTELLQRTMPDDSKSKRYTTEIVNVSKRMVNMVNDLLKTLSGEETIQLNRQPCRFGELVQKAVADAQGTAVAKSIDLTYQLQGTSYPIWADARRLYHLVLNLVDNAIKYSSENTHVEVVLTYRGDAIYLFVRDQGKGILEEDLPHIFDKFYRSHQVQSESGSGIGLAGVRSIVEAHGGQVTARNRPEGGAEFEVMLPESLRLLDETKGS